jgi:hypothetical protein
VYVADYGNHTIRQVTTAGVVTTLAGTGGNSGTNDGTGTAARFYYPYSVAADSAANIYVADTQNHTIRKVTSSGVVTTFAGSPGISGTNDGIGSAAQFNAPRGVAVDSAGNLYVGDTFNATIRKVSSAGVVTTLAGTARLYGNVDGTGAGARFRYPYGVSVDNVGNVYVADYGNHLIRRMTSTGTVTTIGGAAGMIGSADGVGSAAIFAHPWGIAVDRAGCLNVADSGNHRITKGVPVPTLTIAPVAGGVVVSWPSPSTGFVLQQNANLGGPLGWQASSHIITDDGVAKHITVAQPTESLFFRLRGN